MEPGVVGADFIGVTFLGDEGTMDVRRVEGGRGGGGGLLSLMTCLYPTHLVI